MTPEQQRIEIAKACGYCFTRSEQSGGVEEWHDSDGEVVHTLPDPLNDLNAMHEAEKLLNPQQRGGMVMILFEILKIRDDQSPEPEEMFFFMHATAAQRAEAFLKAKGILPCK